MAPFLRRKARKKHSRARSDMKDQRTTALRLAGLELLAVSDFEKISIVRLTKLAGCSVGAFYYRYPDKNVYLKQLIAVTFRGLENSLEKHLSISEGKKSPSEISLSDFLSHIIIKLSSSQNAGIIRVTLKLGTTDPNALLPYEQYRQRVTTEAENIFKVTAKKKNSVKQIRGAMQIAFAAINDAILMPNSAAMNLGGKDMTDAICGIAAYYIGIKPESTGRLTIIAGNKENSQIANTPNKKSSVASINMKRKNKRRARKVILL